MADAELIVKRHGSLKSMRQPLESHWKDCFDSAYPSRAHGLSGEIADSQTIQNRQAKIMDGVTADSVRVLASSIMGGLTPANSRWFTLDVGTESQDERVWLDGAAQALFENIHASNFDSEAFESILDIICAGWFVLYIDEEKERGGFVFQQWPMASCYCASTRYDGRIDIIHREFELTAQQAVNEYGDEVSEKVKSLVADGKPDERVKFVQYIGPRNNYVKGAKIAKSLPFESCTVELASKKLVRESGYHEFPCAAPRWLRIPETVYGLGPLAQALPDVQQLYEIRRMHLANVELSVAGMWKAKNDGVLNPRNVRVGPRKIIAVSDMDNMQPLQPAGNWQLSMEEIQQGQAAIRKLLLADQLQPQDGPAMTATEVHVRVQMIRQLLGPVFGRFQSEYLQPLIERCFGIAARAGVFTPPPESLANRSYTVRYISPLARAQRMEEVGAIERFMGNVGQIAQAMPHVLDLIDGEKMVRTISDALGVPADVLRSDSELESVRQERMQQQQAQQMQATMAEGAVRAAPELVKQAAGEAA